MRLAKSLHDALGRAPRLAAMAAVVLLAGAPRLARAEVTARDQAAEQNKSAGKAPAKPGKVAGPPPAAQAPARAPAKTPATAGAATASKPNAPAAQTPKTGATKAAATAKTDQAKKPSAKAPTGPKPTAKPAPETKAQAKTGPQKPKPKPEAATKGEAPVSTKGLASRRDPFDPLVGREKSGPGNQEHLPPGKAGLVVSTLRLDGVVRSPRGMLAVVSNPQQRVYFLREGDQLYDGRVERITMDAVSFHETGKDPFGKPVERLVSKHLYSSAGEQR